MSRGIFLGYAQTEEATSYLLLFPIKQSLMAPKRLAGIARVTPRVTARVPGRGLSGGSAQLIGWGALSLFLLLYLHAWMYTFSPKLLFLAYEPRPRERPSCPSCPDGKIPPCLPSPPVRPRRAACTHACRAKEGPRARATPGGPSCSSQCTVRRTGWNAQLSPGRLRL